MATAAVHVNNVALSGATAAVEFHIVSVDSNIETFSGVNINFARPPAQVVADIKAAARQVILSLGGPTIIDADIYLFGGPT